MTRALKAAAAIAAALIVALLLASVAVVALAVLAWPFVALIAFGSAREAMAEALGLHPREESPPWT